MRESHGNPGDGDGQREGETQQQARNGGGSPEVLPNRDRRSYRILQSRVASRATPGGGQHLTDEATLVVLFHNAQSQVSESACLLARFAAVHPRWRVVLVDDGSRDGTVERLREAVARNDWGGRARVVANARNLGMGGTLSAVLGTVDTSIVAYTDCDLPYGLDVLDTFVESLRHDTFVIASRVHPESRFVMDPSFLRFVVTRHFGSRVFNALTRCVLLPGVRDSQAGLKVFRREALLECLPRITRTGFSFDLELLFIARRRGIRLLEQPVTFRYASEPSTVRFLRDSLRMLGDVASIRIGGFLGRYG